MALELFHFQYENNFLYKQFSDSLGIEPDKVNSIIKIPFLPIQFFKTHRVVTTQYETQIVFESSGTTGTKSSKHHVKNIELYKKSFTQAFELFYGKETEWCILGLLPSYLERNNSSLIVMVDELIKNSNHYLSGFYLNDFEKLQQVLLHNEILQQPTLLIGVTYALLDFAEKFKMKLTSTTVMETGGMKGRREELTREQVHEILQLRLGTKVIHSEYGMTELLSQAYSNGKGLFKCAPWMKVLVRDEDDPLQVKTPTYRSKKSATGAINIIDLANIYSCAFIATDDLGKIHSNDHFEVLGRCDASEARGCSLLTMVG
jgi:phenylacetate-coenzyme A ligase PaaK-like adenylate-forming protein